MRSFQTRGLSRYFWHWPDPHFAYVIFLRVTVLLTMISKDNRENNIQAFWSVFARTPWQWKKHRTRHIWKERAKFEKKSNNTLLCQPKLEILISKGILNGFDLGKKKSLTINLIRSRDSTQSSSWVSQILYFLVILFQSDSEDGRVFADPALRVVFIHCSQFSFLDVFFWI